jgi:diguanylate cyclase (GGDEF)-like protein
MGRNLRELVAPGSVATVDEASRLGFGQGLPVRALRAMLRTKDGGELQVEANMSRIRHRRQVVGALGVARDITERLKLETELQHRLDLIGRMYDASAHMAKSLGLEETLETVVRSAADATQATSAAVILVDEDGRPGRRVAMGAMTEAPLELSMRPNGVSARVLATGEPAIFTSLRQAAETINPRMMEGEDGAAICLPLEGKERRIGVMWMTYGAPRTFATPDLQLLQTFASQMALAIGNADLYSREQHRARLLEAVTALGREAVALLDLDVLLKHTVRLLNRRLGHPVAAIMVVDEATRELVNILVASDFDQVFPIGYRQPESVGILGRAVTTGAAVLVPDVSQEPTYVAFYPQTRSELAIPLRAEGKVLGVMNLESDRLDAFSHDDAEVLQILGDQIGVAMRNAELYGELTAKAHSIKLIHDSSVEMATAAAAEQVLEITLRSAVSLAGADSASIYLVVPDTDVYEKAHLDNQGKFTRNLQTSARRGQGLTGYIEKERLPVLIEDTATDPRTAHLGLHLDGILSSAGVPLMFGDQVQGVLYAARSTKRPFPPQIAETFSILANAAAVALSSKRLMAERERAVTELSALNQISQSIGSALELDQVLPVIREQVGRLINIDNFFIALYDEENDTVSFPLAYEDGEPVNWPERRGGSGLTEYVIRNRQPLLIRGDLRGALAQRDVEMIVVGWEPQGWLGVPLMVQDKVVGVMVVQSKEPDRFDVSHQRLLMAVGSQAAIAIQKARLLRDARRKTQQLQALHEAGKRTSALTSDAEDLLRWIAAEVVQVIGGDDAGFRLLQGNRLVAAGRTPGTAAGLVNAPMTVNEGLSGAIVRSGEPIVSDDLARDRRTTAEQSSALRQAGYVSFLGVPLRLRGAVIGALAVFSKSRRHWSQADVDMAGAFGDQAIIAMDNARLFKALSDQASRDSLTQVYNHGYFLQRLHSLVEERATPLTLIMLDIDHFKEYNDRYGHVSGDLVLKAIVQAIQRNIHKEDVVGRWGGEEFGILLARTDAARAVIVAERIRHTLAGTLLTDASGNAVLKPTVSQGISVYPDMAASGDDLVSRADAALYRAKDAGRDRVCLDTPAGECEPEPDKKTGA